MVTNLVDDLVKTLRVAGLEPEQPDDGGENDPDVVLEVHAQRIGFVCRGDGSNGPNINALIYDWYDTLQATGFDKIVLVLEGYDIADEHREMAERYGIAIWSRETVDSLFETAVEEQEHAKTDVLEALEIVRDEMELLTFYRDRDGISVEEEHGMDLQAAVEEVHDLAIVPEETDELPFAGFKDADGNYIEFYRRAEHEYELRFHRDETGYDEAASLGDLADSQIVELITRFMKQDFDVVKGYVEGEEDIDEVTSVTTILKNLNTFRIEETIEDLVAAGAGAVTLFFIDDSELFLQCERHTHGTVLKYPTGTAFMQDHRDAYTKLLRSKGFEKVEKAGVSLLNEQEYMEDTSFLAANFGSETGLLSTVVTDIFEHIFDVIEDQEIKVSQDTR